MVDVKKRERSLSDYCQYLKGVGPSRAAKLANLGIENVDDLLTHYPRKYYDRRFLRKIAQLRPGEEETFLGQVLTASSRNSRRRRSIVTAAVGDETGLVQVVWFNQSYLLRHLKPGSQIIVSGRLRFYRNQRQVVNPEFEVIGDELDQELLSGGRIVPVYRLTAGLSQRFLRTLVARTLELYRPHVVETLPREFLDLSGLPSRFDAIKAVHFPDNPDVHASAEKRLKLEELFFVQLMFSLQRIRRERHPSRPVLGQSFELLERFVDGLPFELTGAQARVLEDIKADLGSTRGLNRLLQGDVGSGKTVVAGATLLAGVEADYQAAFMVPTEILACQHYDSLAAQFDRIGVKTALLTGSLKRGEKRTVHAGLAAGHIDVVIGTHALIQSDVKFKKLGVVVIDEQHRFGVRQRAVLMGEKETPHMLVMTATPIPRTLALTAYADLELSVIDEMPATRAPVTTHLVPPEKRDAMYDFVRKEWQSGARAYFLYPVIEETEKQDLQAATTAYEALASGPLGETPVGLLHGKMKADERNEVMRKFSNGEIGVLVATTVVEVGVHVPEATIMAVHHPERFGLSQLHQLRGRVGRGGKKGYCFLLLGEHHSEDSLERFGVLVREADGFTIAEEDLRIRGPGEFVGVRQHGVPGFKLANPLTDRSLVESANRGVKKLLEADPGLATAAGRMCRRHLETIVATELAMRTVV